MKAEVLAHTLATKQAEVKAKTQDTNIAASGWTCPLASILPSV